MENVFSLPVIEPTRSHSLVEAPASVGRHVEAGLPGAAHPKRGYAAGLRSFENYGQRHQISAICPRR